MLPHLHWDWAYPLPHLLRDWQETELNEKRKRLKESREGELPTVPVVDALQSELDELIAAECFLCGELMVRSIHKPLVSEEDDRDEIADWSI